MTEQESRALATWVDVNVHKESTSGIELSGLNNSPLICPTQKIEEKYQCILNEISTNPSKMAVTDVTSFVPISTDIDRIALKKTEQLKITIKQHDVANYLSSSEKVRHVFEKTAVEVSGDASTDRTIHVNTDRGKKETLSGNIRRSKSPLSSRTIDQSMMSHIMTVENPNTNTSMCFSHVLQEFEDTKKQTKKEDAHSERKQSQHKHLKSQFIKSIKVGHRKEKNRSSPERFKPRYTRSTVNGARFSDSSRHHSEGYSRGRQHRPWAFRYHNRNQEDDWHKNVKYNLRRDRYDKYFGRHYSKSSKSISKGSEWKSNKLNITTVTRGSSYDTVRYVHKVREPEEIRNVRSNSPNELRPKRDQISPRKSVDSKPLAGDKSASIKIFSNKTLNKASNKEELSTGKLNLEREMKKEKVKSDQCCDESSEKSSLLDTTYLFQLNETSGVGIDDADVPWPFVVRSEVINDNPFSNFRIDSSLLKQIKTQDDGGEQHQETVELESRKSPEDLVSEYNEASSGIASLPSHSSNSPNRIKSLPNYSSNSPNQRLQDECLNVNTPNSSSSNVTDAKVTTARPWKKIMLDKAKVGVGVSATNSVNVDLSRVSSPTNEIKVLKAPDLLSSKQEKSVISTNSTGIPTQLSTEDGRVSEPNHNSKEPVLFALPTPNKESIHSNIPDNKAVDIDSDIVLYQDKGGDEIRSIPNPSPISVEQHTIAKTFKKFQHQPNEIRELSMPDETESKIAKECATPNVNALKKRRKQNRSKKRVIPTHEIGLRQRKRLNPSVKNAETPETHTSPKAVFSSNSKTRASTDKQQVTTPSASKLIRGKRNTARKSISARSQPKKRKREPLPSISSDEEFTDLTSAIRLTRFRPNGDISEDEGELISFESFLKSGQSMNPTVTLKKLNISANKSELSFQAEGWKPNDENSENQSNKRKSLIDQSDGADHDRKELSLLNRDVCLNSKHIIEPVQPTTIFETSNTDSDKDVIKECTVLHISPSQKEAEPSPPTESRDEIDTTDDNVDKLYDCNILKSCFEHKDITDPSYLKNCSNECDDKLSENDSFSTDCSTCTGTTNSNERAQSLVAEPFNEIFANNEPIKCVSVLDDDPCDNSRNVQVIANGLATNPTLSHESQVEEASNLEDQNDKLTIIEENGEVLSSTGIVRNNVITDPIADIQSDTCTPSASEPTTDDFNKRSNPTGVNDTVQQPMPMPNLNEQFGEHDLSSLDTCHMEVDSSKSKDEGIESDIESVNQEKHDCSDATISADECTPDLYDAGEKTIEMIAGNNEKQSEKLKIKKRRQPQRRISNSDERLSKTVGVVSHSPDGQSSLPVNDLSLEGGYSEARSEWKTGSPPVSHPQQSPVLTETQPSIAASQTLQHEVTFHGILEVGMRAPAYKLISPFVPSTAIVFFRKRRIPYIQMKVQRAENGENAFPVTSGSSAASQVVFDVTLVRIRDIAFTLKTAPVDFLRDITSRGIRSYPPNPFAQAVYELVFDRQAREIPHIFAMLGHSYGHQNPGLPEDNLMLLDDYLRIVLPHYYLASFGIEKEFLPQFVNVKTYKSINHLNTEVIEIFCKTFSYNQQLILSDLNVKSSAYAFFDGAYREAGTRKKRKSTETRSEKGKVQHKANNVASAPTNPQNSTSSSVHQPEVTFSQLLPHSSQQTEINSAPEKLKWILNANDRSQLPPPSMTQATPVQQVFRFSVSTQNPPPFSTVYSSLNPRIAAPLPHPTTVNQTKPFLYQAPQQLNVPNQFTCSATPMVPPAFLQRLIRPMQSAPRPPNTSTTFSYPLITPVNPAIQEPRLNEQASPLDFSIGAKFVNETLQHAPTSQEPFNTSRLEKKEEISRELNDILQSIQSTSAKQVNAPYRKQSILTQSNSNWNNNGPAVTPLNCRVVREAPTGNLVGGSASSSEHGLGHELNPIRVVDHTMPPCLLPGAKLHNGSVVFVQNADGTKSVIKLQPDEPELTINDVYSLSNMEGSDVIAVDTMRETELNTNPASPVESEQEAMNLKIRNKKRSSPDLQKVVERLKKRVTGLK